MDRSDATQALTGSECSTWSAGHATSPEHSPAINGEGFLGSFGWSGYVRSNRGFTASSMVATPPAIGHRSYLRRAIPRRQTLAKHLYGARMHARKRIQAQSMRNLTLGCLRWSAKAVMAGEELKVADSGDGRPGEIRRFGRLRPSRLDSFLIDDQRARSHRLDCLSNPGVACNGG
jgi:hypothetical protein